MAGFKIAQPNEALIVSGKRGQGDGVAESQRYKIVASGDRVFVWPIIQSARELALDLKQAVVPVSCVTQQGIPVVIRGVVAFKVGSDNESIANAAQRFLHDPTTMSARVHELFAGHIRGIVGSLTVEQLIRERESLTSEARKATSLDMEKMGLVIDSLQIAEIDDPSGYIENLSKPDIARVQMDARIRLGPPSPEIDVKSRIAQAQRDREASEQEAQNSAQVAAAQREAAIKRAGYQAEVDQAEAEAAQAGPLAAAKAQEGVVTQNTEVARLRAIQREQELVAEVEKPAQAERSRVEIEAEASKRATILAAEAEADATKATGEATAESERAKGLAAAEVTKAKGEAEGAALEARAKGLASESDAVINNVGTMTVLNGAEGVTDSIASLAAVGRAVLGSMKMTENGSTNGHATTNGHAPVEDIPVT